MGCKSAICHCDDAGGLPGGEKEGECERVRIGETSCKLMGFKDVFAAISKRTMGRTALGRIGHKTMAGCGAWAGGLFEADAAGRPGFGGSMATAYLSAASGKDPVPARER